MGQSFGYEGHVRENMQLAIRQEASKIFLTGRYLKSSRRGARPLCQVFEQMLGLKKVFKGLNSLRFEPCVGRKGGFLLAKGME